MKHLGKLFKKYRVSRGLTLRDVAEAGISTSQLSRFEQGKTDLTITKFALALDEINVPIDEFMSAVCDSYPVALHELLEKLYSMKEVASLEDLLVEELSKTDVNQTFQRLNTTLIKLQLQRVSGKSYNTTDDMTYLTEYLFSVENWGCYELLIFMNALDAFSHKTLMALAEELNQRTALYKEISENRRLTLLVLLNAYLICIERDEWTDALFFEKALTNMALNETELYERIVFHYAKALYQFKYAQDKNAISEMENCIAIMRLVSSDKLAQKFENHLTQTLALSGE